VTSEPIRILAVAGSLREASINRRLARLAAPLAPAGVELVEFDALTAVEPFDEDSEVDGFPPGAAAFVAAVRAVDGVLIVTPEYNGSIPGQLKNALDWASRPDQTPREGGLQASAMFGRPVAVASASNGQFGAVWARDELVKVLRTQGARPLAEPSVTIAHGNEAFDVDGQLRSGEATAKLQGLLDALASTVRALRTARAAAAAAAALPE
jgi:chromate reductase